MIELGRADLALLTDPGSTRVVIPSLSALTTSWTAETAFVRFHGDTHPTAFDGEGEEDLFPMTCLYPRARHDELLALLNLIKVVSRQAPDPRMLLRTHGGQVPGLDAVVAVRVEGPVAPVWTAAMVSVPVTFRVVQHNFSGIG